MNRFFLTFSRVCHGAHDGMRFLGQSLTWLYWSEKEKNQENERWKISTRKNRIRKWELENKN